VEGEAWAIVLWDIREEGAAVSFLSGEIARVLSSSAGTALVTDAALAHYEKRVIDGLNQLSEKGDLRIHDPGGGALRGPIQSRKWLEDGLRTKDFVLRCQEVYLTRGTDNQPTEVPYFRAVFNSNGHVLRMREGETASHVRLVGYEAPLMRKKTAKDNPGISGRCISCDLVGLETNRGELYCIEGKTDPNKEATHLDYALLEAYAYGLCLHYHASDPKRLDELKKEIALCFQHFYGTLYPIPSTMTVHYVLALPRSYFTAMSAEFAEKRAEEASRIEPLLRSRPGPVFGGYVLLGVDCRPESFDPSKYPAKQVKGKRYIVPVFRNPVGEAVRCRDIRTAMAGTHS